MKSRKIRSQLIPGQLDFFPALPVISAQTKAVPTIVSPDHQKDQHPKTEVPVCMYSYGTYGFIDVGMAQGKNYVSGEGGVFSYANCAKCEVLHKIDPTGTTPTLLVDPYIPGSHTPAVLSRPDLHPPIEQDTTLVSRTATQETPVQLSLL